MRQLPDIILALVLLGLGATLVAQGGQPAGRQGGSAAAEAGRARLAKEREVAKAELAKLASEYAALQEAIAEEKAAFSKQLDALEEDRRVLAEEAATVGQEVDSINLSLQGRENANRKQLTKLRTAMANFFEVVSDADARLHVTERALYAEGLAPALEPVTDDLKLGKLEELLPQQIQALGVAISRLEAFIGGVKVPCEVQTSTGAVVSGQVALFGPTAVFVSDDETVAGTAAMVVNETLPVVEPYSRPSDQQSAIAFMRDGQGALPIDPTLGKAHAMIAAELSVIEEIQAGGTIMYAIVAMAGLGLLIALYKWLRLAFLRTPSKKRLDAVLGATQAGDHAAASEAAEKLPGPVGKVLRAGVANLGASRELVEEIMFERILTRKHALERMVPFIGVCAASAPLLGLLGTVSGIITTFKSLTVAGAGDVKSLSGGISEALITTKWGLIVAIPALILHAFLSRKVRGIVARMETSAMALLNAAGVADARRVDGVPRQELTEGELSRLLATPRPAGAALALGARGGVDREDLKVQVTDVLSDLLEQSNGSAPSPGARSETGGRSGDAQVAAPKGNGSSPAGSPSNGSDGA